MLGRDLPALIVGDKAALGDREEGIMGLVILSRREIRLVGRDDRNASSIGQIEERRLARAFRRQSVSLELDVDAIAERHREALEPRLSQIGPALRQGLVDRPIRPARKGDQPERMRLDVLDTQMRTAARSRINESPARETQQIRIALRVGGQENDRSDALARLARPLGVAEFDRELQPDDRLNALARELFRKLERAIKVVGVGQSQGRHLVGTRELGELGDRECPLQE